MHETAKTLTRIAITASALCVPVSALAQAWSQYSFPDQGFDIQLPGQPSVTTMTVSTPSDIAGPAKAYVLKSGAATYTVRVVDLSKSAISGQDAIHAAETAMSSQGSVREAATERIDQQFGREISIDQTDGGKLIGAIFFVNRHLYELSGTANAANAMTESSNLVRFQQSLEFIDQNGDPPARGGRGGPGGRGPNPEAFAACSGKSIGDKVQLETPQGTAEATCILVARPDRPPGQPGGNRGNRQQPPNP